MAFAWVDERFGSKASIKTIAAVTCGAAMLVPLKALKLPPIFVETILIPGAVISNSCLLYTSDAADDLA